MGVREQKNDSKVFFREKNKYWERAIPKRSSSLFPLPFRFDNTSMKASTDKLFPLYGSTNPKKRLEGVTLI